MIKVNLYSSSRYAVSRKKIRDCAVKFLYSKGINHAQVDVSIVGERKISQLNQASLKHEGATDVLSFPHHEKDKLQEVPLPPQVPPHLGDVVICFPEAVKTAKRYGKFVDDQICFYLEHSLMHLLGYHHQ